MVPDLHILSVLPSLPIPVEFMCSCVCMNTCTVAHVDIRTAVGVGFSLPSVGPGELTRVVSLGGKHFYPLSRLTSPPPVSLGKNTSP